MKKYSIIHIIGIVLLILTCIPIVYLLLQAFKPTETVLSNKLLFTYIRNTVLMIFVVGFFAGLLGLTLAWIISFYDFPFRRFFKVVLALPLAIPPYIAAVSYSDFMYANGLFPRLLGIFGITKHFDIMNMYGAMFIYSITLYPYVYIACLSFFKHTSASFVENARMLKANWFKLFYKVGLPLARLPLVAGLTLVIMELVSDFGVIDYYGVQGFSTGIYKIWHNYSDFYGAIRLSAIFLCVIFVVVYVESFLRRRLHYFTTSKSKSIRLIEVKNSRYILIYLSLTLLITFIIPFIQLMYNGIYAYGKLLNIKLI
ncbi:MAG: ABC transporter permease subunit, partial [Erysipelotrichaceae bacterium]|nr:ABC transporter permease subunit [Erysipelotrichaceae bacterium]